MRTENLISGKPSGEGSEILQVVNPATQVPIPGTFVLATEEEIDRAAQSAYAAWKSYRKTSGAERARLLRAIAAEVEGLGDALVEKAVSESGLPQGRIIGERGRTCNQLRLFADLVEEGSWVDAVIDHAQPERQPIPKPDLRKWSVSLGPVAVFTASNFPLAFSTAGGDTASALAAGCPVIVKAHPAHLGTNALVAQAISKAVAQCGLPEGLFSSIQGGIQAGQKLVQHPLVKAVGFTGSFQGGMALTRLAQDRPEPIPVYAEMGSTNPIFILPGKIQSEGPATAKAIAASVNLGAGQFCTNPGLLVLRESAGLDVFLQSLQSEFEALEAATMLHEGIFRAFEEKKEACLKVSGVEKGFHKAPADGEWSGTPAFAKVAAADFIQQPALHEEVFGPFTLVVVCKDASEMAAVANGLQGQLTATLMGLSEELAQNSGLVDQLSDKAGRVLFNGVPTGVEVCPAMHHGGPFPATSNPAHTSVGTDAIKRFVRPVTFQQAPQELLPPELKDGNPLGIWRTVNGKRTKE